MLADYEQVYQLCKSNLAYKHMQSLRGSSIYWKKTMNDLFAMIRQIDIPTFFVTLSAAELSRWPEVVECIAHQNGKSVNFDNLSFNEKAEIIRDSYVTKIRMWYNRLNHFMKFLPSPANPISKITDYFYSIEFQ